MDIRKVAFRINELAADYEMVNFQAIRKDLKNLQRKADNKIFTEKSIFPDKWYAFHLGGRREIQYNIGCEEGIFRYGLAFSLGTNQTLPDISIFKSKIERFNEFVKRNPNKFSDMYLWYYASGSRSKNSEVRPINESLVQEGNFIFIGKYFRKKLDQLTLQDYEEILTTFDKLLDVYMSVEGDSKIGKDTKVGISKQQEFEVPDTPTAIDINEPTEPERVLTKTYRILRDTKLARQIKWLHKNQCQICDHSVELKNSDAYAEAHHVQPLGSPHNGPDVAENILCVCPNHHVQLDYGAIKINKSELRMHPDHNIDDIEISG